MCRLLRTARCRYQRCDATLVSVFIFVATYGIYIIATLVVLDSLIANIKSIFAVLGAAGLVTGDTFGNIVAGLWWCKNNIVFTVCYIMACSDLDTSSTVQW